MIHRRLAIGIYGLVLTLSSVNSDQGKTAQRFPGGLSRESGGIPETAGASFDRCRDHAGLFSICHIRYNTLRWEVGF
jgi:hypothetical protein